MELLSEALYDLGFLMFLLGIVKHSKIDMKEWLGRIKYRSLISLCLGFNFLGVGLALIAKLMEV